MARYKNLLTALGIVLMAATASPILAQVTQPIDPTQPPPNGVYSYAVKFVCGFQKANIGLAVNAAGVMAQAGEPSVKAGNYATEINIFNPSNDIEITKRVLILVEDGNPVGREPNTVGPSGGETIPLPNFQATMDDCNRIAELVFGAVPTPFPLTIGYFVVQARVPLDVTAVYTAELCSDFTNLGSNGMCSSPATIAGVDPFSASLSIDVEQIRGKFLPQ